MNTTQGRGAIRIVTDSSCDLPRRLIDQLEIAVVSLVVSFNAETYLDLDLSPEAFWEKAAELAAPQTSQPSPGAFEEVFEALVKQGKRVLCITLTGEHSGTAATARLAARRFGEAVQTFDSQSLSLGLGFQVLEAALAAEAGCSMEEVLAWLKEMRLRTRGIMVLDTLENMRRGGRADRFITLVDRVARFLQVKPIVGFVDGRLQLLGIARSFARALQRTSDMIAELGPLEHLAVSHVRSIKKAEELADRLSQRFDFPREKILVREAGAVVASHAGLGAMAVFAMPKTPTKHR